MLEYTISLYVYERGCVSVFEYFGLVCGGVFVCMCVFMKVCMRDCMIV